MNAVVRAMHPNLADGARVYARAWRHGWSMPEPLSLPDWSDAYRVLPREGSSEPGRWRTERTPYLREIMVVLSPDHPARRVVFMACTQVGKTECGNNWVGSNIHQNPGPMMVLVPTQMLAKRWSKQRLDPMIEATPVLRDLIKPARARDSGNTTLLKEFPGGMLVIAGANSAVDVRSMPVRDLYADEVDGYPDDVDGEGAPLTLAERRTSTFPRRKIFITSTPTIKDASVIESEFLASDQRRYHVPCPHCNHMQALRIDNLHADGTYLCESCNTAIAHHHKTAMLAAGEWRAGNPAGAYPGFHISALYSPVGLGYTWAEIAAERAKALDSGDREILQTYYNTLLGEPFEDETGKMDWQHLKARAGGYQSRTIPRGCLMLTAGVDVQDDRLAVLIAGWGRGERAWIIDWVELSGDPDSDALWAQLDELLDRPLRNAYGVDLRVLCAAVDTGGHHTHTVYNYCRVRQHRLRIAVKGSRYPHRPIIAGRPSAQDVNTNGGVLKAGVDLWHVGADTAKGAIFTRYHTDTAESDIEKHRIRFPSDLPDDFYQQITAERYDAQAARWRKLNGRRNEGLDCFVYAYAAACYPSIRVHMLRDTDWEKIEAKIEPKTADLFSGAPVPDAAAPEADPVQPVLPINQPAPPPASRPRRARQRNNNYVGGWK